MALIKSIDAAEGNTPTSKIKTNICEDDQSFAKFSECKAPSETQGTWVNLGHHHRCTVV